MAFATSSTDIDIDGSDIDSDFYADTYTVAPYAAYRFLDYFFVSGMFSYAYTDGKSTMDDMDEGAYLLEDNGGKWKAVGARKYGRLCEPNNTTLPKKIKKYACVS